MKLLRCRICGETYLGAETPSRCPFCGADAALFVGPGEFTSKVNSIEPTAEERADLLAAIELERSNTRFYLAMSAMQGDETLASAYKRLARIEAEHCSVFSKLAGTAKPADLATPADAPASWCDGIADSVRRETTASALYAEFASRATHPRLREVFSAIADVETDHLAVDALAHDLAGCDE